MRADRQPNEDVALTCASVHECEGRASDCSGQWYVNVTTCFRKADARRFRHGADIADSLMDRVKDLRPQTKWEEEGNHFKV